MFDHILVAIAEAEDVRETMAVVKAVAQAFTSEVTVYHARERIVGPSDVEEQESIRQAQAYGERIVDELDAADIRSRVIVESIRPERLGDHILAQARSADAALIIVGGHHAHNVRESVFGDIGKVLAHRSVCPVLFMPSTTPPRH